ncbi:MAG: inositol monophosphatase [Saprospiraceae bacterium]|nr:inositol monophosphatase [Saprospiraceae bacterium]
MDYSQIVLSVINLVRETGFFIKSEISKVQSHHIIEKSVHSLVSYVDIEAEKKLVHGMKQILPGSDFITEENTTTRSESDFIWIIDPLDGTTNFLKGIPVFSISVGLLHLNELVLGVVFHIMMDEMFYAVKGTGAYLNGQRIKISSCTHLNDAVIATGFPYQVKNMEELTGILHHILDSSRGVRRLGSAAIDLAYTAAGRFDSYYEALINPWDVAAGILLVKEAGGLVTDMNGNESVLFARNILASNPFLQAELLSLIKKVKQSNHFS